jgi:hypothetical protein
VVAGSGERKISGRKSQGRTVRAGAANLLGGARLLICRLKSDGTLSPATRDVRLSPR